MSNLLNTASLVVTPNSYKEGTLFSVIPNTGAGDMTVVRATTATRVNSAGLVEIVPYNFLLRSEDFISNWGLYQATKTSGQIDPFGGNKAIKLQYNTTLAYHCITQGIQLTGNNAHSVYAKAGELQFLQIASAQTTDEYANFNLGTGVIGTYGILASNVQIQNIGNGWYRCSVVFTNGSNGIYCAIASSASMDWIGIAPFAGANTTDGLYLYGAQINAGSLLPYLKTETRLNIPRLDYSKGTCPSLLVEPQRTNLVTYSEEFNDTSWVNTATIVTSNSTTAPNGLLTADTLVATIGNGQHSIQKNITISQISDWTFSCYIKNNGGNFVQLVAGAIGFTNTNPFQNFNLQTGTLASGSLPNSTITNVGNGWYRIAITVTNNSTGIASFFIIPILDGTTGRVASFTGDGINGIYAWGAQLEAGAYATSYIPTTSASVTRNADVVSKTGISSLIGQSEGTIVFNINVVQPTGLGAQILLAASNDSESQLFIISYVGNTGIIAFDFYIGSTYTFSLTSPSAISAGLNTVAVTYKTGSYKLFLNGSQVATSTNSTAITNTISKLRLGSGTAPMYYNFVSVWKEVLNDEQLESLTGTGFNSYAAMASFYNYTLQ